MQREDQSGDQSRSAFRMKMGIYFVDVKGIIHEMIQQAMLAYDQGYVHHMWDHLIHNCTCAHTQDRSRYCRRKLYLRKPQYLLFVTDVYFIISK